MNKFLNISNNFTIFFLIYFVNFFSFNKSYGQCNSTCFCIQIDEIGEVSIVWDTLNITNVNLFEHKFYADTGGGFFLIGSETDPTINSFNFQNYFAGNNISSYFIKSLYGSSGANFNISDTISTIFFDLVNLFDGRVALSWNHPVSINTLPLNSQYIIENSSPSNPPTSAVWNQVVSLPIDSLNYTDNISICSSWLNYRIRLSSNSCDFVSNLDGGFIEDQQAPDAPVINLVTQDTSNNQMYINWSPSIAQDVTAYIVFKFSNGSWNPLDTIYGIQNTTFYDTAITTFQNDIVKYSIAAMDSCSSGNPPQFNTSFAGDEHNNILLTAQYEQCTGEVLLSFNEYVNWPFGVSSYKIYYKNDTNSNWQLLDSTNSLNYSYLIQQGNMNYNFIVVAESDSLTISSLSNIVEFYANQPPIPQSSYISQVQVHSDTILVKYLGDNGIGIKRLNIYRSLDNGISFELISSELNPIFPFIYYDLDVYPGGRSYLYQMSVTDSCLNEVAFSNFGQSIFLDVSSEDYLINNLVWSPYQNWENGVEKYEILTSNNLNPTFELLVEDSSLNYLHDFTNFLEPLFDGRICYQISAIENQSSFGLSGISTSNIKCLQNEPIVFIPNALDLNGVVNYWKPIVKMIDFSDYKVSIYNRSGELIALLDNIGQVWDGKIMNSNNLASMGVYLYQLEFKSPSGKYFHKKGHITLIR
jgi:gliding motility-associated-like protein